MERITSTHNPRVQAAARLRSARERAGQGRFLIDGLRELGRAMAAGIVVEEVFVCNRPDRPAASDVLKSLPADASLVEVTSAVFAKLSYGERDAGIVAVARTPKADLANLRLGMRQSFNPEPAATAAGQRAVAVGSRLNERQDIIPLVAVLAGVEKPGNVGAVLRSADAAGVSAVIVADGGTDLFNPNAIRASLGTIFSEPLAAASTAAALAWLRQQGLALYTARVDAGRLYTDVDWTQPSAIVLGSEAAGLSSAWTAPDVTSIRLPMHGAADSLNVSVTAAVIFYEALRQRQVGEKK